MHEIAIVQCNDYEYNNCRKALDEALREINGLDFIFEGCKIVIKANLVAALKPERAATTHPSMLCALCDMLYEKGAEVTVGDSSGGMYNLPYMSRVYSVTGVKDIENHHARLNKDFGEAVAEFPEGVTAKEFYYTKYLDEADYIINFCKLKTHGMMGLSAGVKNMFGAVPGIAKPEYHYKYPDADDFASMLVDINQFFKPVLTICDGVYGMEGNGPTAGTPRYVGAVIASKSQYKLDVICAKLVGIEPSSIKTLVQAEKHGLISGFDDFDVYGSIEHFAVKDYKKLPVNRSFQFNSDSKSPFARAIGRIVRKCLRSKPKVIKKECVGCAECCKVCPAKAILMSNNKPKIDRKKCICCFCCQEFCPKGAMKVKRTMIAKIFTKGSLK